MHQSRDRDRPAAFDNPALLSPAGSAWPHAICFFGDQDHIVQDIPGQIGSVIEPASISPESASASVSQTCGRRVIHEKRCT